MFCDQRPRRRSDRQRRHPSPDERRGGHPVVDTERSVSGEPDAAGLLVGEIAPNRTTQLLLAT